MRSLLSILLLSPVLLEAGGGSRWVDSRSGQFHARAPGEMRHPPPLLEQEKAEGLIVLTPELLAVSAERLKERVLEQLGARDRWRGRVSFFLDPSLGPGVFSVASTRYTGGWRYRVSLAPKIRGDAWMRGCVGVLLLEMANRLSGQRSAEVPFWLIDGMVAELRNSEILALAPSFSDRMPIPRQGTFATRPFASRLQGDSLEPTRRWLSENAPADISELFFPSRELLHGDRREAFSHSSHFLYRRLLDLPAGRDCLLQFLSSLSGRINWQQAFIPAFRPHFERMLDVEKWWSVALSDLAYQAPVASWSRAESLACLERTLVLPALVGERRDRLAARADFNLRQVVRRWRWEDQEPALERVANRLRVLGVYADPEVGALVRDYQGALESYLDRRRQAASPAPGRMQVRILPERAIRQVLERLGSLEERRGRLAGPGQAVPPAG